MIDNKTVRYLEEIAWRARLELIEMFSYGTPHHIGGSLSCVEILTSLYFYKMNYLKENMGDPKRDRFVMSKGHSVPAQYVMLAMLGIIPKDELKTIKKVGTRLQGHPDVLKTPGIEAPTGSLGMGLSYANGMALAAKLSGLKFNIYLLIGDGELQEGQIWEAAMTTSHYRLNDICAIVDTNRFQSQGPVDRIKNVEPVTKKWQAFGWQTLRVNGHDIKQLCDALDYSTTRNKKPCIIIADTIKGKGVKFLENTHKYHNSSLTQEQYQHALEELKTPGGSFAHDQ
jgi:transketolase